MDGIKIEVTGNIARVIERPAKITSGTVGLPVEFTFDGPWDGLHKIAVFRAGNIIKDVENPGAETTVPWEVLAMPGMWLSIGAYGTNEDGSVAIPTIWANVCVIHNGVDPEGDPSADPTAPIWLDAKAHLNNTQNPHNVTAEQIGAVRVEDYEELTNNIINHIDSVQETSEAHTENRKNPHGVTCEQIGAAPVDDVAKIKELNGLVAENIVPEFVAGLMEYKNGGFTYTNTTYANTLYCYTPEDTLYDVVKGTTMYFTDFADYDNARVTVYYSTDGGKTFSTNSGYARTWKAPADCKVKIKLLEAAHKQGVVVVRDIAPHFVVKTPNMVERSQYNSRPIVTFIDDDGLDEALNNWEAISDETGVKPTIAVVTSIIDIDNTKYPTWNKIKRLWCKGFDFISHTHGYGTGGHKSLTTLSADEIESQLSLSVNAFHENGVNPRFLAYPGNATNAEVIAIVKKYFVGAVMGENVINHAKIEPFRMFRVSLNHETNKVSVTYPNETTATECSAYRTEEEMRSFIDEAVATNGWIIIMSHIRNQGGFYYDDNVKALIVNTIKYAGEQGCEILPLSEAYDKFRNRVTCDGFVVDCDGVKHV